MVTIKKQSNLVSHGPNSENVGKHIHNVDSGRTLLGFATALQAFQGNRTRVWFIVQHSTLPMAATAAAAGAIGACSW